MRARAVAFELRSARYDAASSVSLAPSTRWASVDSRERPPTFARKRHIMPFIIDTCRIDAVAHCWIAPRFAAVQESVATRMAEVDALFWQLAGYFAVIAVIKHLGEYFLKLAARASGRFAA